MAKRGNGEGTIFYSEKLNRWCGQFVAGRKPNGQLNRKSVYGSSRKEVKEKMTLLLADIQNNSFVDKSNATIYSLGKEYIDQLYNSNKIIETSYARKLQTLNNVNSLPIANKPIQKVTIPQINSALSNLTNYSSSTINKVCELISAIYNYAVLLKIVNNNPFLIKGAIIKPRSEKPKKKVEALTFEEQKLLEKELNNSNDPYKDIIYIALYTGMRIGEILALQGKDINIKNKTISINKTLTKDEQGKIILGKKTKTYAGTREIPFLDVLSPIMSNLSTREFCFKYGDSYVNPTTINTHFKKICKDAGIKPKINRVKKGNKYINSKSSTAHTHILRHTFATRCIESGMSAVTLSRILGHNNIQITLDTYTDVFNNLKSDEMKKLEKYFLVALKLH